MEKMYKITESFFKGKIDIEVYKKELLKFSEIIDGNRSGNESLSFLASAIDEINNLDSFDEDNNLRVQALVADIFNNFAHSLMSSKTKNVFTDELRGKMFGLKTLAAFKIIKECIKTNNKSYGIIDIPNEKDKVFVLDIPGCGQIKWHFPKSIVIYSQEYPFQIEDNKKNLTNKNLILQEKTTSEIKQLSEHNQKVIGSLDVDEMNQALGLCIPTIPGLDDQIKEPTLEELEQLGNRRETTREVSHETQVNE